MSKIARVKFIRDKEPNIKALTASSKVLDGALYIATDTGTMWMGVSATSLMQIKDNINTNTTYTLTKNGNIITLKGSDGSSVNVTDSNTIYNNATASAAGLMSAADKSKLDSVATGANKTVVDASFVDNSTNPVQSKVVKSALDGKSDTGHTHDDRYYTESEINTKLNAKANSSHTHTKSQITDFPTSMPASDVKAWAKADSKPSYTISEVSGNLPASRISGTIDAAHLPSYVDDVIEGYLNGDKFYTTKSSNGTYSGEIKAEAGKIYVDLSNNKTYRWSGSTYVVISETITLGTTHATAGYGDESRAAYNHSTSTGNPHKTTKTDLGLGNVENKSSATIRGELTSANVTTALGYTPPRTDTNTHYTTRIVAGAANGTANAATTNGNTHINVTDDNTFRSGVVIKGTGATSVTSDASGSITVYSTDTNTWRPIQNNLTSTATDQSLSAAQGKALNDKFSSYVPTSRTVNGKALSSNITLSAGDVGAAPSGHSHNIIADKGNHNEIASGTTPNAPTAGMASSSSGLYLTRSYGDEAAPATYGNILNVVGAGTGQLFMGWSGKDSTSEHLYYRSHRDSSTGGWGKWNTIIDSSNIGSQSVSHANTAGSVAWTNVSGRPSSMPASDVYSWAKQSSKPSYSWSEISNKPTIPSVGNGTVTITQNGTTKGTFTLNQSDNATIALTGNDTNTWRPEEVIVSSSQPNASTCKLWIKV